MDIVSDAGLRPGEAARPAAGHKALIFLAIVAGVVFFDYVTKMLVVEHMRLYQQIDVIGEYVRLTFIYNPGAAFGIHLGRHSRIIFLVLSFLALILLVAIYLSTPAHDRGRLASIALICGGAIGNLVDRVRSERGVVDFLDLGVGHTRWPVFNIADIAVTSGAILLALSLWREEREADEREEQG
jgi:signal peptidase II